MPSPAATGPLRRGDEQPQGPQQRKGLKMNRLQTVLKGIEEIDDGTLHG